MAANQQKQTTPTIKVNLTFLMTDGLTPNAVSELLKVNHRHSPQEIPRNECCCCEQPISEQQKIFAVKQLDAHNNNIHFVAPIHTLANHLS